MFDFRKIYSERRNKIYSYMKEHEISVAVFEDKEDARDCSIRYLSGHPSDAVLILLADSTENGKSFLIPWDENLAEQKAYCDKVLPYTSYGRDNIKAIKSILNDEAVSSGIKISLSPATTFPAFNKFSDELKDFKIACEEKSVHDFVAECRAIKDSYEIDCTKKACAVTDFMTEEIIKMIISGKIKTEMDVALYVERELRMQNCERTSFDTLAAGPQRSFAIHAFPGYTKNEWACDGISLLDYGVCYEGYASDCTITIAKGNLSKEQKEILTAVQKAADSCIDLYKPGLSLKKAALKADEIFDEIGRKMPHSLGHGTGLEIHEAPYVSTRTEESKLFKTGNIVTLEPGLYDPLLGGCRLENDVLITETGNEVLTKSKIFYL